MNDNQSIIDLCLIIRQTAASDQSLNSSAAKSRNSAQHITVRLVHFFLLRTYWQRYLLAFYYVISSQNSNKNSTYTGGLWRTV